MEFFLQSQLKLNLLLRRNKRKDQQANCFLLINKKLQLSEALIIDFLLVPLHELVWYFIVDNASPKQSIVGGTMEN